jgi:hypothetical protein
MVGCPRTSIPSVWGGAGAGEACDACEAVITPDEFVMEGVTMTGEPPIPLQLHVQCFYIWDDERIKPVRKATGSA